MLHVFYLYVYALLAPRATLLFVTYFIVVDFGVIHKILEKPFLESIVVSSYIIVRWVYIN